MSVVPGRHLCNGVHFPGVHSLIFRATTTKASCYWRPLLWRVLRMCQVLAAGNCQHHGSL